MSSFSEKPFFRKAARVFFAALLAAGTVLILFITGCGIAPESKESVPEREIKTDEGETETDKTETKSDGDVTEEIKPDEGEKEPDGEAEKEKQEDTKKEEEIAYVEGDPSYFWRIVPKTTVDPDNPLRILVNSTHAIPDGYVDSITLKTVAGYKLDSRAAAALKDLIAAAEQDGITITLCSGFRTHERQIELYTSRIKKEQEKDKTLTWKEACLKAARTNALPGTSEHETGLCFDFADLNASFDTTKEFAWLKAHAEEYGFVLRYPKDKGDITGIIYEPWHWRYVGVEDAKAMNDLGMCLEEYVEYLAKE